MATDNDSTRYGRGAPQGRPGQPPQNFADGQRYPSRPDPRLNQPVSPQPPADPYARPRPAQPQDTQRRPGPETAARPSSFSGYRPTSAVYPGDPQRPAPEAPRQPQAWDQPAPQDFRRQPAPAPYPHPAEPRSGFVDNRYYDQEPAPQPQPAAAPLSAFDQDAYYKSEQIYQSQLSAETAFDPSSSFAQSERYAPPSEAYAPMPQRDAFATPGPNPADYYPAGQSAAAPNPAEMHDRFFAAEPAPEAYPPYGRAQQPAQPAASPYAQPAARPYAQPTTILQPDANAQDFLGSTSVYDFDPAARDLPPGAGWDDYPADPAPAPAMLGPGDRRLPEDHLDADFFSDQEDEEDGYAQPQKKGGKLKLIAAVLAATAIGGGGLAYGYKHLLGGDSAGPTFVAADPSAVKETPDTPGGKQFANQNKKIYDRLAAAETDTATDATAAMPKGETVDERIAQAKGADKPTDYNEPKPVRTIPFNPDGTPAVTPDNVRPVGPQEVAVTVPPETPAAPPPRPTQSAVVTPPPSPAKPPATPAAAAKPAAAATAGAFFLQLASTDNQEKAVADVATLQKRYQAVLDGSGMEVRPAEVNGKTWYRIVVTGVPTKEAAGELCVKLKAAGVKDCLIRKE